MTFCKICHTILQRIKSQPGHGAGYHHRCYQTFKEAVAGGCYICKRFQRENKPNLSGHQVATFNIRYTYVCENEENDNSGLPKDTVQIVFTRDDAESESDDLFLNMVPVLINQGATAAAFIYR